MARTLQLLEKDLEERKEVIACSEEFQDEEKRDALEQVTKSYEANRQVTLDEVRCPPSTFFFLLFFPSPPINGNNQHHSESALRRV